MDSTSQNTLFRFLITILLSSIINIAFIIFRETKTKRFANSTNKSLTLIIYVLYFFTLQMSSWTLTLFSNILAPFYLLYDKIIGFNFQLIINLLLSNLSSIISFKLGFFAANKFYLMKFKIEKTEDPQKNAHMFVRDWFGLIFTGLIQGFISLLLFFLQAVILIGSLIILDQFI